MAQGGILKSSTVAGRGRRSSPSERGCLQKSRDRGLSRPSERLQGSEPAQEHQPEAKSSARGAPRGRSPPGCSGCSGEMLQLWCLLSWGVHRAPEELSEFYTCLAGACALPLTSGSLAASWRPYAPHCPCRKEKQHP